MTLRHAPAAFACLALVACATSNDRASFVTKTSFGLDGDSAPPSFTVAYDRFEGYVGPRFEEDGTVYPVVGFIETDGSFFTRSLKQTYAGGNAARIATGQAPAAAASAAAASAAAPKLMVFATGTTVGLKVAFADTGAPTSFTLGYKRKEASIVPVDAQRQPSVLASLDNATNVASAASGAFGVRQYFATGVAADNLARLETVRKSFRDKAGQAIGAVGEFRTREARQGRLALDAVACVLAAPDDRLPGIWNNAEALDVFPGTRTVDAIRAAGAPAAQRQLYAQRIAALVDPDSETYTQRLELHATAVCG